VGRADVALDVSFGLRDVFFYSLIPFAADHGVNRSDPSGWKCGKDYMAWEGVQGLARGTAAESADVSPANYGCAHQCTPEGQGNCCCRCYPTNGVLYFLGKLFTHQ